MRAESADTESPTILVPLDGSALAERALPIAERVALAQNSALLLVRVLPLTTWAFAVPGGRATPERYQELLDHEDQAARQYLGQIADRLRATHLQLSMLAVRGDPASTLIYLSRQMRIGLVVMATHGWTGMARVALGSVAERVARHGPAPVLFVRAFAGEHRDVRLERALVPLDGSLAAERALPVLIQWAGRPLSSVTLVRVVAETPPSAEEDKARRYLSEVSRRLAERSEGWACAIEATVLYGSPAEQIIQCADQHHDLVIMATRDRTSMRRWVHGSVADRVLHGVHIPLLLVRSPVF